VERSLVDSENPSRSEDKDVELGARASKQIICVCDCFLSYSTILVITYTCVLHSFPFDYSLLASFFTCRLSLSKSRR